MASPQGKPNPANPGRFSLGEGGRDPDNPGLSLTCAGPGWSRVKAQEKVIQALSSLFFSRLSHRFHCGTFSLLSAEEIKNNELLAHSLHMQTHIYIWKFNPWVGKAKHIQWIYIRLLTEACLEVSPQCQGSQAEPQRVLKRLMAEYREVFEDALDHSGTVVIPVLLSGDPNPSIC